MVKTEKTPDSLSVDGHLRLESDHCTIILLTLKGPRLQGQLLICLKIRTPYLYDHKTEDLDSVTSLVHHRFIIGCCCFGLP